MGLTVITGNDVLTLDDRIIQDLADQSVIDLSFPNKVAALKVGKNRNAIFAENATGYSCDLKIRLIRRSKDDGYLLGRYNAQTGGNYSGFVLLQGSFVKQVGDGAGNISYDTYTLQGGIFVSGQPALSNPEGNTDQAVTVYEVMFANCFRVAD